MQQDACASEIDYVVVNGSAEVLVDEVRTDADGSGPCAALYGGGASDHRAQHVIMHVSFSEANGATASPKPSRTVYRWSEADDALLTAFTAEVAPRAPGVSRRLRAEIGAISVDAASHLVIGIIADAQEASVGSRRVRGGSVPPRFKCASWTPEVAAAPTTSSTKIFPRRYLPGKDPYKPKINMLSKCGE